MPPALTKTFARFKETVAGFSVAQRTIAIIGVAVLALGVFALSSWMSKPALTPLFSGLNAKDASAVVDQLNSAGISYELADGGGTVLVAQSDVYEQRLAAAAAGLPTGDSNGYTLLDSMGVTSSEFQQSVTYKRAIEGELANTIGAMDGVRTASVQLAIPEESVFVSEQQEPTASVFIETTTRSLTTDQVEAIIHLVSASVTGMNPENVAVIDQEGKTLSTVGAGASGGTEKQASEYEARVASNIQELLDTVVGTGNATVTVAAEVDKSTSERLEETYTPAEGVPSSSEQTTTETYTGGGGQAGVLGTEAVVGGEDGTYENTSDTRNNLANKTTESINTPAGSLTRQTIAVAVNQEAADEMNVDQIEALVASAAGINTDRGDDVTVEVVPFSATGAQAAADALEEAKKEAEAEQVNGLIRQAIYVGGALLAVIILLVVIAIVRRRKRNVMDEVIEPATPSIDILEPADPSEAFTVALDNAAPTSPTIQFTPADLPEPPEQEEPESTQVMLDVRRAELGDLARRDPARTADLLRRLIRDKNA